MTSLKSIIPSVIETDRLKLELFDNSPEQYECIIKSFNSPSSHASVGDMGLRTPQDIDRLFSMGNLQPSAFKRKDLVLDVKIVYLIREGHDNQGPLIGVITLPQRSEQLPPDLGYAIQDEYQGKGYATEASKAVLDMLLNKADIPNVIIWPVKTNQRSINIAKKLGMVEGPPQKGRDGTDQLIYVLPGTDVNTGMTIQLDVPDA